MVCEVNMELYIKCHCMKIFISGLYNFIQKVFAKEYHVKFEMDNNSIYIGHKTFYMYIFTDEQTKVNDIMMDEYGIDINNVVIINVYNKMYEEALKDIAEIINWLMKENTQDFMLLDEQSVQILYRKKERILFNDNYVNFPYYLINIS